MRRIRRRDGWPSPRQGPERLLGARRGDFRKALEELEGTSCGFGRLPRRHPLAHKLRSRWGDRGPEEEACDLHRLVERADPFLDERSDSEQAIVIHC
jgi:hypothetical protein